MGEILNLERSDGGRIRNILLPPLVCCEPTKESALKFTMRSSPRHGMAGMRHQPKGNMIRRSSSYELRMPRSNIPVGFAMNQQHWNFGVRNCFQRIGLEQIDPITKMRINSCGPDCGTGYGAPEPWAEV